MVRISNGTQSIRSPQNSFFYNASGQPRKTQLKIRFPSAFPSFLDPDPEQRYKDKYELMKQNKEQAQNWQDNPTTFREISSELQLKSTSLSKLFNTKNAKKKKSKPGKSEIQRYDPESPSSSTIA
jgi:hypothetical protein